MTFLHGCGSRGSSAAVGKGGAWAGDSEGLRQRVLCYLHSSCRMGEHWLSGIFKGAYTMRVDCPSCSIMKWRGSAT